MNENLTLSKEEINLLLDEEKGILLEQIKTLKLNKVQGFCKKYFVEPTIENFLKYFPENYLKIIKSSFDESAGKANIKLFLLKNLKEENFPQDYREKEKDLEEYFLLDFFEKNLDFLLNTIQKYYLKKSEKIELSFFTKKIEGLYGENLVILKLNTFLENIQLKITSKIIDKIFFLFERNLENNFEKIKDRIEIPPLLLFQMSLNSLNKRYPNLFENLSKENEKILKEKFLKLKERALILCYLYSFAKFFIDKNEKFEALNEEKSKNILNRFLMGMELQNKIEDLNIIKKSYIFKKIIIDKEFNAIEIAEELFEDDLVFIEILREKIYSEYEKFISSQIIPLLKKDKNYIPFLRNLIFSPSFFAHKEITPLYQLKENYLPYLNKKQIIKPFEEIEKKNISNLIGKILQLKKNFSKISREEFKEESLKIFEEISNSILFWEDYEILLAEFSKEFIDLPQIPDEVLENYSRICFNYLSMLLNNATFLDFPEEAKAQIDLFETLKEIKEKEKIILISDFLKNPITYTEWKDFLFELKLLTPYKDFYKFIKKFINSKEAINLLKIIVEILQKEDFDLSILKKIFQDLSFIPDIKEDEFFNLILNKNNFPLYRNELKEKIFGLYPSLDKNLKKIVTDNDLYSEILEIEYTKKEKAFLNFLKELNLSKSFSSLTDYIRVSKLSQKKGKKEKWEELFISIKHYLIQIEQLNDGFSVTLNISGQKEGPHPFEGQQLKSMIVHREDDINWCLNLFQKYTSFLMDLEEELFFFEYIEPKRKQKYKIQTKKVEKFISFKRKNGKFQLKVLSEKQTLKKIWAKAWAPFYVNEKDDQEIEKDLRLLLSILKNVLL